jgi:hypothetical protein
MLIRNAKLFNLGMFLAVTFLGVLILIFSPVFGGQNGLEYADDLFNRLSKGSSFFIPRIIESNQKFKDTTFEVTVKIDKPEIVEAALKILPIAGVQATAQQSELTVSGNLGKFLDNVLADSKAMFFNDGKKIASTYGMNERTVMEVFWNVLSKSVKELQKQKKIAEAKMVTDVMQKGIEPAYNFFGIEPQNVGDKAFTMIGLLVFYVAYTMWWGYAIFYLFDGIGLSMKKAKVKKEV